MLRRRLFRGRHGRFMRRPRRVHAFRRSNPGPLLLVNPSKKKKAAAAKKNKVAKKGYTKPKAKAKSLLGVKEQAALIRKAARLEAEKELSQKTKKEKSMSKKKSKKGKAKKAAAPKKTKKSKKGKAKKAAAPKKTKAKKSKAKKSAAPRKTKKTKARKTRRVSYREFGGPWTGPYHHFAGYRYRRSPKKYRGKGKGWWNSAGRHRKASKHGWSRRNTGKKGKKFYVTSKGRRYHRPTGRKGKKGKFRVWNPKYSIRTGNPDITSGKSWMNLVTPVLLGVAGFLGASFLLNKLPASWTSWATFGGKNWASTIIPLAVGAAAIFLAPKYLKFLPSNVSYGLGFGLMLAGGVGLLTNVLPADILSKVGLSTPALPAPAPVGTKGFVYRPGAGVGAYTLAPSMSGYVNRPGAGIGTGYNLSAPIEDRYRRTLGANTIVAPGESAPGGVPTVARTGYETVGSKPYGLGLPMESRRYNKYSWIGVYDKGVYE